MLPAAVATCNPSTIPPTNGLIGYGTAEVPYQPYVPCLFNGSSPSNASYGASMGQCVQGKHGMFAFDCGTCATPALHAHDTIMLMCTVLLAASMHIQLA